MTEKCSRSARTRQLVAVATASILLAGLAIANPPMSASASTSDPSFGVGAPSLATPASGSRYIYVATNGTDFDQEYQEWYNGGDLKSYNRMVCLTDPTKETWGSQTQCTEPTIKNPLKTVQLAMRIARPGDVIVVRGGTYAEAIGWGIVAGQSSKPITLQSHPGEKVTLHGILGLVKPHYWRISGIRFTHNPSIQTVQSIVTIGGGTGWRFTNNSISGSPGVANLLIVPSDATVTSESARREAAPHSFYIGGNCITDNRGTGTHGQYHNIYMMSSQYSTGGVIERNLLAGAPRGANIKVAAANPESGWTSPKNLTIRDNTLLDAASGITVGLQSQQVAMSGNLIARPKNELQYDGAVKTYQLSYASRIEFTDSYVAGYRQVAEYDAAAPAAIVTRGLQTGSASFSGSVSDCSITPTSWPALDFGHRAPAGSDFLFTDVSPNYPFGPEIGWLSTSGVTAGFSDGSFRPLDSVNRDAMAAFLYRFAGSPAFTAPRNSPFTDVTPTTPFYKEIMWLSSTGITGGFADGTFRPGQAVDRGAMAAFLYRFAGEPRFTPPASSPFSDISPAKPFYREITWLSSTQVTGGFSDGTFRPGQAVARDAMAAFLYRFDQKNLAAF